MYSASGASPTGGRLYSVVTGVARDNCGSGFPQFPKSDPNNQELAMSRYRLELLASSLTAVLFLFASSAAARAQDMHTTDSLEQVKRALADNKAILLDVREPAERKAGYLESSTSLPLSQMKKAEDLKRLTKEWDKSKVIYTHCAAGRRALTCAPMLKELGFEVRALKAGYKDLLGAGFEKASDE